MGFFSWKTSDTKRSIANVYSGRKLFTVHMITEDGQIFTEKEYEGYGKFGGKDFYDLVVELNKIKGKSEYDLRLKAIDLCFKDNPGGDYNGKFKLPKIVEVLPSKKNWKEEWNKLEYSETCEHQGYFYSDDVD